MENFKTVSDSNTLSTQVIGIKSYIETTNKHKNKLFNECALTHGLENDVLNDLIFNDPENIKLLQIEDEAIEAW
jgi:hypothetical protein